MPSYIVSGLLPTGGIVASHRGKGNGSARRNAGRRKVTLTLFGDANWQAAYEEKLKAATRVPVTT